MSRYYVMGNFSQQGIDGLLTGASNREAIVKKACEAMGCKFISYDITEGEFDFILIVEGDSEQAIAAKGGAMLSGDFDLMIAESGIDILDIVTDTKTHHSFAIKANVFPIT